MIKTTYKKVPLFLVGLAVTISASNLNLNDEPEKKLSGQVVNNFSIGELLSTSKENLVPAEPGELMVIKKSTFEKGAAIIQPESKKNYSKIFYGTYSRFICWEITIQAEPKPFNRDLNLEFQLRNDHGDKLSRAKVDSWIPARSKTSTHNACWGWPFPDFWETGSYTFDVFPGEEEVNDHDTRKDKLLSKVYFKIK